MILDCTLRDGGYYLNWDFDSEIVRKYISAISASRVDIVEIGFRNFPKGEFLGAYAYSSDDYLLSLDIPNDIALAVMINASDVLNYENGAICGVNELFTKSNDSRVDIVRVAVHIKDIQGVQDIVHELNALGYRVFVNLMHVDSVDTGKLENISAEIYQWDKVDVLYLADSLGSMEPYQVTNLVRSVRDVWDRGIGFHAHDNKGVALQNSLAAMDAGASYLDSTICGMGRGAGNAKTEYLLVEIISNNLSKRYVPDAVFPLALQDFTCLKEKYQWGANIYYYLSAIYGIHPTYIQEMMGDQRYGIDDILSAIKFLGISKSPSFSFEKMLRAADGVEGSEFGDWDATGWLEKKKVLILGGGGSIAKYINQIKLYVEKYNPFVLCLNINDNIPNEIVDGYVACHETRIMIESTRYPDLDKPIILPKSRVPKEVLNMISDVDVIDYGLRIGREDFSINPRGCVMKSSLALMYAISFATAAGADEILLVGIDGYGDTDPRQCAIIEQIDEYAQSKLSVKLVSLTPTKFPVEKTSIFQYL